MTENKKEPKYLTAEDAKAIALIIDDVLKKYEIDNRWLLIFISPDDTQFTGTVCVPCAAKRLLDTIIDNSIPHMFQDHKDNPLVENEQDIKAEKGQDETDRPIMVNTKSKFNKH